MIGKVVSHYKVLEKLGEGGMGVVYKAQDTRLDRIVALKFLPPDLDPSDTRKERFSLEAKSAAALNHPNICTIHGLGEHESVQFIEMEYVKGITLREKLAARSLPVPEAIAYAVQICSALEEAHSAGIVHRDIKPENIMVTPKNQIKVMDFGLAKLKGSLRLTRSATTVGTLSYMSPEQIRGSEADARSDIFSAGVLLYEMLTGRSPFRGEHEAAIMYSIVNEDPPPLANFVKDAPGDLQQILIRALQKDRDQRYQTAGEFLADLQGMERGTLQPATRASGTTTISASQRKPTNLTISLPDFGWKSFTWLAILLALIGGGIVAYFSLFPSSADLPRLPIAVADFVNETKEPELDGLSGMLITSLEQSRRLSVITRARMFDVLRRLGQGDVDRIDEPLARQVCKEAGVSNLVTASIRKFGKLYTIDLKILDPDKEEYLLTVNEQGEGQESIPSMLDRLSEKTRLGLKERVSDIKESKQELGIVTTQNLEAYKHYFRGEELFGKRGSFDLSIRQFEQAVRLDTTFALAHYRLAWAYAQYEPALAKSYMSKAMALKNRLPEKELLMARALEQRLEGQYDKGLDILKSVEQRFPDDKQLLFDIAHLSFFEAKLGQAEQYYLRVLTLDPTFTFALSFLTNTYGRQREFTKMKETAERYVEASGGSYEAYHYLAQAYAGLGDLDGGLGILRKTRELFPEKSAVTLSMIELLQLQERYDLAENEARELLKGKPKSPGNPDWSSAMGYLVSSYYYTGRYHDALQALEELSRFWMDGRDTSLANLARLEKAFLLHLGLGEINGAWAEAQRTLRFGGVRGAVITQWRLAFASFASYRGDAPLADSLSAGVRHFNDYCRMLLEVRNGNFAAGAALADTIVKAAPGTYELLIWYDLARAQYEIDQLDAALETVRKLQSSRRNDFRRRAFFYPMSFVLEGKIHEKKGERKLAEQSYEKFHSLWKKADKNIPILIEAKSRLAALRRVPPKVRQ